MADGFENAGVDLIAKMESGLDAFAEMILADSLEQCPVETGTLRRSAKVYTVSRAKNYESFSRLRDEGGRFAGIAGAVTGGSTKVVGYGFGDEINPKTHRPASDYAVPVHERVEAFHLPPTKAKFLEDPVLSHAADMEPLLAAYMKSNSGSVVIGAMIEAAGDLEKGAGVPPGALDAGDHPKGTPHE